MTTFSKFRYIPLGKQPSDYSENRFRPKVYVEDFPEGNIPNGWRTEADNEYSDDLDATLLLEYRDGDFWEVEA